MAVRKIEEGAFNNSSVPLCVDMDGTLIQTDMLFETLLIAIKQRPWLLFVLPIWLIRGKAYLKQEFAGRITFEPSLLPYHARLLSFLRGERARGRDVLLCTAGNQAIAHPIADYTQAFTGVLASDGKTNLKGRTKADLLVGRYGSSGFDYVGNDSADIPIWREARKTIVVSSSKSFIHRVRTLFDEVICLDVPRPSIRTYLKAIRINHWVKNALIFVPLVLDHQLANPVAVLDSMLAFLAFSLIASATYVINDLLDLESDRAHATKRNRPFATGVISVKTGLFMAASLGLVSLIILLFLPPLFAGVAAVYVVSTLLYSFRIKTMVILDTCFLAGLFTVRVIGGTVVVGSAWSFWLLAFSMFFFLSLAFTKRAAELKGLHDRNGESAAGRGYIVGDLPLIVSMGVTSGYVSVLIVALYINSDKVQSIYAQPETLWLICPLLLYWIGRVWLKTVRGEMNEDPIIFAMKDRISHIAAVLCALVVLGATFIGSVNG